MTTEREKIVGIANDVLRYSHSPTERDLCRELIAMDAEISDIRLKFHVNMLRAYPAMSHEEISALLEQRAEQGAASPAIHDTDDKRK